VDYLLGLGKAFRTFTGLLSQKGVIRQLWIVGAMVTFRKDREGEAASFPARLFAAA